MDKSLQALCEALKKIAAQIKPQSSSVSFVLITGKINQGKTVLLRQSNLNHYPVDVDNSANFFYNNSGIILELGEGWLNQSDNLLAYTLKHLNRCHKAFRISGVILCVDSSDLLLAEPLQIIDQCKSHSQLLDRFGQALGYRVDASIMLTKLDTLVGFCEFFQSEHDNELAKPLGFSLDFSADHVSLLANYKTQFDQMIEVLGQQIIKKLHPARSGAKRTLIREFPLQLASLRIPVQSLIQSISTSYFRVQAIYFTSAEQGGICIDRLNKKIQHEYALTVQDKFLQSSNYRPYFIDGALLSFQQQTKICTKKSNKIQKIAVGATLSIFGISLTYLGYRHFQTASLLEQANRELLTYETLISKHDNASALYHLSLAEDRIGLIPKGPLSVALIQQLESQLKNNAKNKLQVNFLPELIGALEETITNPSQTQLARYRALKVYLMLAEPEHFKESDVMQWFGDYWITANANKLNDKPLLLLKNVLRQPLQAVPINRQLVVDARNYLNALPAAWLYYSLAKIDFPSQTIPIKIEGFDLAAKEIPVYFTRKGFQQITELLPQIASKLQQENWVLARQDLGDLQSQLEQAYCQEYVSWWQNFTRRTLPHHYQGYQQARQLIITLQQSDAITQLVNLIQQHTSPELSKDAVLFNKRIATQFTNLNLMSTSASQDLAQNINELEKYITTLSLVNDHGKTIFGLTKLRFQGDALTDPLSVLYSRSRQLPEPISTWAKQIADDTWYIFINESRDYINKQWKKAVYQPYITTIAQHYPIDPAQKEELSLTDFDNFFSPSGTLNTFVNENLKPFLDTTHPQWKPKELNGYLLPISSDLVNELIRANVISNMFFPDNSPRSKIEFSLQKISLDPVVSSFQLTLGKTVLTDNQESDSYTYFNWPQPNAKLILNAIDGNRFELAETGTWAFFKMLQKVNVLVDNNDSSSLQILFEVNGNSGRYLLKTQNQINPFSPGILTGFNLDQNVA